LKLALTDITDIRADHESEKMLGIDAIGMRADGKQCCKAHDCCPEYSRANSKSESHG
jgi:hypothetical protein